jgi:indolepyruvate ferredoxin oxidoreductase beta subunit
MSKTSQAALATEQSSTVPDRADRPTNVLVVGVGGQGVIMISKVLAQICQQHDFQVKQSEVHGMAKRGGVVFSHVRFGAAVHSPTIPAGEADILLAMEWAEGLRWLPFLSPEGSTFIVDTQQIVPPFACRDRRRGAVSGYSRETVDEIMHQVPNTYALNARGMAAKLGNSRVGNTVLLGALSTALDFSVDEWQATIAEMVPPNTIEVNSRAFEAGREWALQPEPAIPDLPAAPVAEPAAPTDRLELQITEAWCKGCDICVKMCPERCLHLNDRLIAELARPQDCTGCRLCEWLCPDFAIELKRVPAGAAG